MSIIYPSSCFFPQLEYVPDANPNRAEIRLAVKSPCVLLRLERKKERKNHTRLACLL